MITIAINGFGRIGRRVFRLALQHPELEVVAINDLADSRTLSHLLKYDSVYGKFGKQIDVKGNTLIIGGKK
jgi:glyceraldehyde 3-phosphate dehydrogenase